MACFPGNFIHGNAIKLQYRHFLIPWVKRNCSISVCAKATDYGSSFPVKHIPKKSLKNKEKEAAALPVNCCSEKTHNGPQLNFTRVDVPKNSSGSFLDTVFKNNDACRFSSLNYELNLGAEEETEGDFMAVNEELVEEPEVMVENSCKKCRGSDHSRQDAEKLAIELLASRAFTALELKKKLQGRRVPLEIVDAVIADFKSRGLINDCLYAETYTRSRWSSLSWGPRRIRQALSKKGISEVDADKAIKLVFENEGCGRQDSEIAMSKLSVDQLYVQASKQWRRSHGVPPETRKSRIVRWLQYRGFNWSVIKHVLKKLESESSS